MQDYHSQDGNSMRVLIVSAYFAPSAMVGAKRFSFLSRSFRDQGLEVAVLTMRPSGPERGVDPSLPAAAAVHVAGSLLPFPLGRSALWARLYERFVADVIAVPDQYVGWLLPGLMRGRALATEFAPEVVIATGPPFTAFAIGAATAARAGAKLVLDYRDPWTAYPWMGRAVRRRQGTSRRLLERRLVRRADALVFATAPMLESFEREFGRIRRGPACVITNGFESGREVTPAPLPADSLNILYAGNFYGERQIGLLVEAADRFMREGRAGGRPLRIHVFGKVRPADRERISACGMESYVHEHAPVAHAEVLRYMKAADVLYLPSGGDVPYALPFKVFDYLSVRRPVLALAPERSAVADLLRELRCGELVVPGSDPAALVDALERLLSPVADYSFEGAERYGWDVLGRRYVELLRAVRDGVAVRADPVTAGLARFEESRSGY